MSYANPQRSNPKQELAITLLTFFGFLTANVLMMNLDIGVIDSDQTAIVAATIATILVRFVF